MNKIRVWTGKICLRRGFLDFIVWDIEFQKILRYTCKIIKSSQKGMGSDEMIIKKKKRFWAMMLTGLAVTFSVSSMVRAADGADTKWVNIPIDTATSVILTSEMCSPQCNGHSVTGNTDENNIIVESGTHDITFTGNKIELAETKTTIGGEPVNAQKCALEIRNSAHVTLKMKGGNTVLTSGDTRAGIFVAPRATLTIQDADKTDVYDPADSNNAWTLTAEGGVSGAGIGGDSGMGQSDAGTIEIKGDYGTITAKGGNGAAGIGGASGGGFTKIAIDSKKINIEATGGKEASGIGCGYQGRGGEISIKGDGTIKAKGGTNTNNDKVIAGISGNILSSERGSKLDIFTTGSEKQGLTGIGDLSGFNGLVWFYGTQKGQDDQIVSAYVDPVDCTVLGQATLTDKLYTKGLSPDCNIFLGDGTSLIIPEDSPNWPFRGTMTANGGANGGKVVNAIKFVPEVGTAKVYNVGQEVLFSVRDDVTFTTETIYDGTNQAKKVLVENTQRPKLDSTGKPTGDYYAVNRDDWTRRITYNDGDPINEPLTNETKVEIKNAGTYTVTYLKKGETTPSTPSTDIVVKPADLNDCKITVTPTELDYSEPANYPSIAVTMQNGQPLTLNTDYFPEYIGFDQNDFGEEGYINAWVGITATDPSNSNNRSLNFRNKTEEKNRVNVKIYKTSVENADITLAPESVPYDGEPHLPTVTVNINGNSLTAGTDYDVKWDKEGFVDAATYTATITGKGSYRGEKQVEYVITPKQVKIASVKANGKPYDGNNKVEITEIILDENDILPRDRQKKTDVEADLGEEGTITAEVEKADVGSYTHLVFGEVVLKGDRSHCYTAANAEVDLPESAAVEITQIDGPEIQVVMDDKHYSPDAQDTTGKTYAAQVGAELVKNPVEGYEYTYEYSVEGTEVEEWKPLTELLHGIAVGESRTFRVRTTGDANIASSVSEPLTYTFNKLPKEAPAANAISLQEPVDNQDGTYTLTISTTINVEQEPLEFSFDNTTFGSEYANPNGQPNTKYVGYVRYKETDLYAASPATATNEVTTDIPKLMPPKIGSDSGETFRGTVTVEMTCEPPTADIYYTINGTDPSPNSRNKIASGESIEIGESIGTNEKITVRAIAVLPGAGMEGSASDIASLEFEKIGDTAYVTRVNLRSGIEDTYLQEDSPELVAAGYTAEGIKEQFRNILSPYEDIAFYDMTVLLRKEGRWEKLTEENFPLDGIPVTIACPAGTSTATHDFKISHMHGYNSDRLGVSLGVTEQPDVIETDNGQLRFMVTSASPIAIAWGEAAPDDGNGGNGSNGSGDGSDGPDAQTRVDLKKLTARRLRKNSPGLIEAGYTEDSVKKYFRDMLSGFQYEDIAYYEMRVSIREENKWELLTEENFPLDGVTVTVKCPSGTSTETHDFAVSHMHSYDSDRLGVYAGSSEEPTVTKTEDGQLQFTVTSASPLAIAWKKVQEPTPEDPTNPEDPDNNGDPNNTGDPTDQGDQGGDGTDGSGGSGTDQSGSGTSGTTSGTSQNGSSTGSATSSIMPRTGDPASFIPWIIAAVVCIGVLVGVKKHGQSKKNSKVQSKKKTMNSKAKRR